MLIAGGLLVALSSRTCAAQSGGFDIAWHDCIGLLSAAQNLDYACNGSRDGNPFKLVVTFTPPADLSKFVGVQVYMELRTSSSLLADCLRLGIQECRGGAVTFPGSRTGIGTGATGACVDPWTPPGNVGGGYAWYSDAAVACGRLGCYSHSTHPGYGVLALAMARDTEIPLQAG